ncbi:MAG: rRNA pseudouridine synthase [Candidatus Levybacteria bacterium]|nr:rRNA pseudouridine synthase [Candidatus Levybacteria bacterium]
MEEYTIRLNKYLANLGICARRDVKRLLKERVLTVNGERAKEQGVRLDPLKDDVRLDGKKLKAPELVYYLLNKPNGIISSVADEFGRKNVTSFIPTTERIYPVGRLDKDTTGLILLTNDGELTNHLTHPKYHVYKVYRLKVEGFVNKAQMRALQNGVLLDDGITAPATVKIIKESHNQSLLEITLHEGRNRQIRRMCETVGIKLLELERVAFGPIAIGNLKTGKYRELTMKELEALKNAVQIQKSIHTD